MGGRRAKYKQPPPGPLQELKQDRPSSKKLGKRKADADDLDSAKTQSRPAKKVKVGKTGKKGAGELGLKSQRGAKHPPQSNGKSKKQTEEEELLEVSSGESEGWEGISDMEDGGAIVGDLSDLESGQEE